MKRQEVNRRILECLEAMVDKYPEQRFMQLLFNLDVLKTQEPAMRASMDVPREVVNEYATESKVTLERLRDSVMWKAE